METAMETALKALFLAIRIYTALIRDFEHKSMQCEVSIVNHLRAAADALHFLRTYQR